MADDAMSAGNDALILPGLLSTPTGSLVDGSRLSQIVLSQSNPVILSQKTMDMYMNTLKPPEVG